MKTLLKVKDKDLYPLFKTYYGECEQCRGKYKVETVQNTVTQWSGHSNPNHKSEHIERNIGHGRFYAQLLPRKISGRI